MSILKSGNPFFNEEVLKQNVSTIEDVTMTEAGAMNKFFLLTLLVVSSAVFTWNAFSQGVNIFPWLITAFVAAIIMGFAIRFRPMWSTFLAPLYSLAQGVLLGAISLIYNESFSKTAPGIVVQAVGLTFGVAVAMFALYKFKIIKVTEQLRSVVYMSVVGIAIFYLISFVAGFFGVDLLMLSEGSRGSLLGIGISLFVTGIAALKLLIDYDNIRMYAHHRAPKYMEWYCAFGLIVTIIWLYLEILQLLSRLASRK